MIQTTRLSNGMTLLVERMPGVRSAAGSWLVPAGTGEEPSDRLGLGAMWSELLMRGAGALGSRAHADACDRAGLTRGVETGPRFVRVGFSLVGSRFADAFGLIAGMVTDPRMDAASIEPARELALSAIDALRDDPQERAMLAARARHFPAPLDRSSLGTRAGLEAITRKDLVAGWASRARPGRSILGVAGDVDPGEVAAVVERATRGWAGTCASVPIAGAPARGYSHEEDSSNQVQVVVMQDAPLAHHADAVLERVVASVLSGGMSGRLFTEVRERRGLCYSVSASYSPGRETGVLVSYVGTTPERAQESLDVLWAELGRLSSPEGRISDEELGRALVGLRSRVVFSGESTGARASGIASDQNALGRARTLDDIMAELEGVTLDRVNEYLARRATGRATIQTLGPGALTPPAEVGGR